jgi:hypothetical protein
MMESVVKVASELREFADWLESEDGQDWARRKNMIDIGVRRSSILWLLDKQQEADNQGVSLLRSAVMVWASEQGLDKRLDLLVKAVLAGD